MSVVLDADGTRYECSSWHGHPRGVPCPGCRPLTPGQAEEGAAAGREPVTWTAPPGWAAPAPLGHPRVEYSHETVDKLTTTTIVDPAERMAERMGGELLTAVAAEGLTRLADRMLEGEHPSPTPGRGLPRVYGATVVPLLVHDALCGYRGAVPHNNTEPPVMICNGCHLAYPQEDAENGDDWWTRTREMVTAVNRGEDR